MCKKSPKFTDVMENARRSIVLSENLYILKWKFLYILIRQKTGARIKQARFEKIRRHTEKNRHQTIRLQMEHISMLSYIQTKWYQLSPASFDLAVPPFFQERSFVSQVYLQSAFAFLAFIRGHSASFLQSERIARSREFIEDSCCLPAALEPRSSIVLSYALTYSNLLSPHQPKAGGPPFLSRTGNVLHVSCLL